MEDLERAKAICRQLKDLGFRISIDDFGSGYSSLGTLQDLTIDVLKLDRTFLMLSLIHILFVDMPPGTSDVFLTVFQSLPVDGIVTVSAPQELVAMIVGKAVNLAHDLKVPVVGLVENMAYFKCDECGKNHHIFGEPQGEAVAKRYEIPSFATLPIDPSFARLCDEGKVEELSLIHI